MPDPLPATEFGDLARRCLDGTAGAEDHARLNVMLLADEAYACEYASLARFEALLKQHCQREAKALLEFVALESEVVLIEPHVFVAEPVRIVPKRRLTSVPVWGRMAAMFIILAGLGTLWLCQPDEHVSSSKTASAGPHASTSPAPGKIAMIQLRRVAATMLASNVEKEPQTLEQRLNDFYLPGVNLQRVPAGDAMRWLMEQLRVHNYARRADLDKLTLHLPPAAENRMVTLQSGPISFAKAVEIVAALAQCVASVTDQGVIISEAGPNIAVQPSPVVPKSVAQVKQDAAALGITLNDSAIHYNSTTRAVNVSATASQQRAMSALAAARSQLAALSPLSFVPLVVPSNSAGHERVLTASEVEIISSQLAKAPAGTLPVVSLPFASTADAVIRSSSGPSLTLSVVPVGEMNQVTIEQIQPSDFLADTGKYSPTPNPQVPPVVASSPPIVSAAEAMLRADQGLIADLGDDDDEQLYTPEGIPIPKGSTYLFGMMEAPPADAGLSLLLVPVP